MLINFKLDAALLETTSNPTRASYPCKQFSVRRVTSDLRVRKIPAKSPKFYFLSNKNKIVERERERYFKREREMWESICLTIAATAGNNIGKALQKKGTVILPPLSFKLKANLISFSSFFIYLFIYLSKFVDPKMFLVIRDWLILLCH